MAASVLQDTAFRKNTTATSHTIAITNAGSTGDYIIAGVCGAAPGAWTPSGVAGTWTQIYTEFQSGGTRMQVWLGTNVGAAGDVTFTGTGAPCYSHVLHVTGSQAELRATLGALVANTGIGGVSVVRTVSGLVASSDTVLYAAPFSNGNSLGFSFPAGGSTAGWNTHAPLSVAGDKYAAFGWRIPADGDDQHTITSQSLQTTGASYQFLPVLVIGSTPDAAELNGLYADTVLSSGNASDLRVENLYADTVLSSGNTSNLRVEGLYADVVLSRARRSGWGITSRPVDRQARVLEVQSALGASFATAQGTPAFVTRPLPSDVFVVVAAKINTTSCTGQGATWSRIYDGGVPGFDIWLGTNPDPSVGGGISVSGDQNYRNTLALLVRNLQSTALAVASGNGVSIDAGLGSLVLALCYGTDVLTSGTLLPESAGWSAQLTGNFFSTERGGYRYRTPGRTESHAVTWSGTPGVAQTFRIGAAP